MVSKKSVKKAATDVVFYYGQECPWCHKAMPFLEEAEQQTGVKVKRVEVWHNESNAKKLLKDDAGKCGGVPFLINRVTGKFVCGFAETEQMIEVLKSDE